MHFAMYLYIYLFKSTSALLCMDRPCAETKKKRVICKDFTIMVSLAILNYIFTVCIKFA